MVKGTDEKSNKELERRLNEVLGAKLRYDPTDERALQTWDTIESQKVTANISIGIKIFLGVIGGLTLVEHATGLNLRIDTLLLERPWGQNAAAAPMRMGAIKSGLMDATQL